MWRNITNTAPVDIELANVNTWNFTRSHHHSCSPIPSDSPVRPPSFALSRVSQPPNAHASLFLFSFFQCFTPTHTHRSIPFCWFSFLARARSRIQSQQRLHTHYSLLLWDDVSLSLSILFLFFSFFWYSPICRLLTLCIRCNRVLVFRQAAFRKTVASFAALFSHSTRDPLEVGFAACTRLPGKFGIAKVLETDDTIRWYRFRKSVKGCILFDSLAILKFNKHKHNVYVMGRFVSMSFFSVRNDSCASLSVRIWDLQLKFSYKREISMYTYEPLCDKIRITSYQFTCRVGQCGFGTTRS